MIAGIIEALIRLINIKTTIITIILITIITKKFNHPIWKILVNKNLLRRMNINPSTPSPKTKKQAAKQSLKSIDQLIERIQNDVAIEALRQEKIRVENELSRGDLEVVVFGTGSSGKTSLIRALLNEIVGNTGPSMGSTTVSTSYRLHLKGLDRTINLIDTPGILEGGEEGRLREKDALLKASHADLMIVVVDSDLREAEFRIITSLAKVGKRLLLVLNKVDLRGINEEKQLLQLLKIRTKDLIQSKDIISTTASPQSIPRPGDKPFQPRAEIDDLVKRLATVLYEEGEELLSDNILLQCRNLGKVGRKILNTQREKKARKCVDRYGWISSGIVVITPLPGIELLGTAAVNAQMVIEVADIYGTKLTRDRAKELAISVGRTLTGLGLVQGGVTVIGSAITLNLPGILMGRAIQSMTAAWLTRVAGASFITYFEQNQDWGDGGIQEVVQRQYDLNRREITLRNFINKALHRVVEPLKRNHHKELPPRQRPQEEEEA
tara:strand:- start:9 stop:1493 length:1485 start_codon:yes stop_codon:yes gene_type:complete